MLASSTPDGMAEPERERGAAKNRLGEPGKAHYITGVCEHPRSKRGAKIEGELAGKEKILKKSWSDKFSLGAKNRGRGQQVEESRHYKWLNPTGKIQ